MTHQEIVRGYYQAINDRDMKRVVSLTSEKCKFNDIPQGKTLTGKNALKDDCSIWLAAFPDGTVQVNRLIPAEDYVVVEFTGKGTHTGPLGEGAEALPATNKKVELRFCDLVKLDKGLISEVTSYYDQATLLRQLGRAETAKARPEARPH